MTLHEKKRRRTATLAEVAELTRTSNELASMLMSLVMIYDNSTQFDNPGLVVANARKLLNKYYASNLVATAQRGNSLTR